MDLHSPIQRECHIFNLFNQWESILDYVCCSSDISQYISLTDPHDAFGARRHKTIRLTSTSALRQYLITVAPIQADASTIWLEALENKSPGIVMLGGPNETFSYRYFPDETKPVISYPEHKMSLKLMKTEHDPTSDCIIRHIVIKREADRFLIKHLQFISWNFDVPRSLKAFLCFHGHLRRLKILTDKKKPAIIHGSHTYGRCGILLLLDILLAQVEESDTLLHLDLLHEFQKLSFQCSALLDAPNQLQFCYKAVAHGGQLILRKQKFGY